MMTQEQKAAQQKILSTLAFEQNEVFDSVMALLDESIKSESARAVSIGIAEDKRAHACGRADSLADFKDLLLATQQEGRQLFAGKK